MPLAAELTGAASRLFLMASLLSLLCGCELPYYWQAAKGQWSLLRDREPIAEIIADPNSPRTLRTKLTYISNARDFAMEHLELVENTSYLTYVDLDRDFATWNVFATPELSTENKTWCFPIAGCVSYRGYFSRTQAEQYAAQLQQQGWDTYVGGSQAYSTLGWFDDPVLNTFIARDSLSLAALLFHELAHQVLYVKDDSEFNESFATSVEQILLAQWVELRQLQKQWEPYQEGLKRQKAFLGMVLENQAQRQKLFSSDLSDEQKRAMKQNLIQLLRERYKNFKQQWDGYDGYDPWMAQDLNNAQLSTIGTYHQWVPAFLAMYDSAEDFASFLTAVKVLAEKDKPQRIQYLTHETLLP